MGRQKVPSNEEIFKGNKRISSGKKDPLKGAKVYSSRQGGIRIPEINIKTNETLYREPFPKMDLKGLFKNGPKDGKKR